MQDKQVFEYARIYVMPRVERGEHINVGVILYSRSFQFLKMKYFIDSDRLLAFYPKIDLEQIKQYLQSFEWIASGDKQGGTMAEMDKASRFRWLTATRSTIIQVSQVHPGFCDDPEKALNKLFEELVL